MSERGNAEPPTELAGPTHCRPVKPVPCGQASRRWPGIFGVCRRGCRSAAVKILDQSCTLTLGSRPRSTPARKSRQAPTTLPAAG